MAAIKQVERIIRILQRLSIGKEITVRQLYEHFERSVSMRTLQRDMIELSAADIPLVTEQGHGKEQVWRLEHGNIRFVPETIGNHELMASYFVARLAELAKGTKLEKDVTSLLRKSKQLISPAVFQATNDLKDSGNFFGSTFTGYIDYGPHSETIDRLITATSTCRTCTVKYKATWKADVSEFEANPYLLLYHKGALYSIVYVPKHDNYIYLPVQRIRNVRVTDLTFKRDNSFNIDNFRKHSFGIYGNDGSKPQQIVLKFKKGIADIVAERIWHQSQDLIKNKDGSLTMKMTTVVSDELRSWIGSWLDYVKVVKPKGLLTTKVHKDK